MTVIQSKKKDLVGSIPHGKSESHYTILPRLLCFTFPQVGLILLFVPTTILAGIYAKYFGLSLAELGSITLLARIFDAVTDPLVGYWSDRVRERTGSRKVFIVAGGLI